MLVDTFITPPYIGELVISCDMIICMNAYSDFLAVGNEYTCDGNHPHVPCMHAEKEPGKASALGRCELVAGLRRDGYVRYGIVWYNGW